MLECQVILDTRTYYDVMIVSLLEMLLISYRCIALCYILASHSWLKPVGSCQGCEGRLNIICIPYLAAAAMCVCQHRQASSVGGHQLDYHLFMYTFSDIFCPCFRRKERLACLLHTPSRLLFCSPSTSASPLLSFANHLHCTVRYSSLTASLSLSLARSFSLLLR